MHQYFKNDTKHIKKMVGIFIFGVIVGIGILYIYKYEQMNLVHTVCGPSFMCWIPDK